MPNSRHTIAVEWWIGGARMAALGLAFAALPVMAHDPTPGGLNRAAIGRVPTHVEPVPLLTLSDPNQATTHFEFVVRDKHGVWLQEIYDLGAIADDQDEIRLAVVRAYEPGKPNAHISEATALRVDVRSGVKENAKFARGWLDSHEVSGLAAALPGIREDQLAPLLPGTRGPSEVQIVYPRGGVVVGLAQGGKDSTNKSLFFRVGRTNPITARLKAGRLTEFELLVKSADQVINDVRDKLGHHQGSAKQQ